MTVWLKLNSDALIMLALVCILLLYSLHVMHAADVDLTTLAWCRETTGTVLGGLLMLITGKARHAPAEVIPTEKDK